MAKDIEKAHSDKHLLQELERLWQEIEIANAFLRIGTIIEIEPTSTNLKKFIETGMQLEARGISVPKKYRNINHWDPRLTSHLEILFPRFGDIMHQRWLKEELLKKHGKKLRRKKLTGKGTKLPKPRRK